MPSVSEVDKSQPVANRLALMMFPSIIAAPQPLKKPRTSPRLPMGDPTNLAVSVGKIENDGKRLRL